MQFRELGFHLIVTQAERRTSAAIDPIKFVLFRAINDSEEVAADAVGDWFHQSKSSVRANRRIHGAPTAFQNIEPDLRGRRHTRANHSMPLQNLRSRREILSRDTIDLSADIRHTRQ